MEINSDQLNSKTLVITQRLMKCLLELGFGATRRLRISVMEPGFLNLDGDFKSEITPILLFKSSLNFEHQKSNHFSL